MVLGLGHQGCILHDKRDFPYVLYADNVNKSKQKVFKDKLKSIPGMNLARARLEQLTPEDLPKVERLAEKTKQGFKELIEVLPEENYPKARTYPVCVQRTGRIENLSKDVTTFFDVWFTNKAWISLNTNAIESGFGQVKNRIWAIGKRWSEPGLRKWLKVVVNKIFYPLSWDRLWSEYLGLDPTLQFNLMEVRYQWV